MRPSAGYLGANSLTSRWASSYVNTVKIGYNLGTMGRPETDKAKAHYRCDLTAGSEGWDERVIGEADECIDHDLQCAKRYGVIVKTKRRWREVLKCNASTATRLLPATAGK